MEKEICNVILGGGGFIGSHLTQKLLNDGHRVLAIDKSFPNAFKIGKHKNLKAIVLDIKHIISEISYFANSLDRKYEQLNIFNLACETNTMNQSEEDQIDASSMILQKIESSVRKVAYKMPATIIHASSASIYGNVNCEYPFKEDLSLAPESKYAYSKVLAEKQLSSLLISSIPNLKLKIFRFFNVFGEMEGHKVALSSEGKLQKYQSKVFQMREDARIGRECVLFGSGDEKRDFVSVDTVCEVLANHDKKDNGIYNLGSGRATSFNEIKEILLSKYPTAKYRYENCPYPFFQKYTCADMSKTPEINPNEEFQKLKNFLLA